jgi:NitT/TauT family transport system substrate-binding protein
MEISMKRILSLAYMVGALSAVAFPASAQDLKKVTMLTDFLISGFHTPYFAGLEAGKFREAGIDLTIQPGKGSGDGAGQIAAGSVQFGVLDPVPTLLAISKGAELSIVATYSQRNPNGFCYLKDKHPNFTFDDLDKVKIAGVNGDSIVNTLKAMKPGKTLDVLTVDGAALAATLISGQADAFSCTVGTFPARAIVAKEAGHELGIIPLADHGLKSIGLVVVAPTSIVKQDPDLVERFLLGFAESVQWSVANPQEAADNLVKQRPEFKAEAIFITWQAFQPFLSVPGKDWFKSDPDAAEATADIARKAYGAEISTASFDNQFVDALPANLLEGKK